MQAAPAPRPCNGGPPALSEAGSLLPARAFLHKLEGGDGHALETLPGFLASDRSMRTLRRFLERRGYKPVAGISAGTSIRGGMAASRMRSTAA